jgi:4'-phosphopantetheinyl transferase
VSVRLAPGDIHVWTETLTLRPHAEQAKLALLSPDEQERALRLVNPEHRRRFIAARAALREILGRYLDLAPQAVRFSYLEHGKPALGPAHASAIRFNLAHSGDLALYAVTLAHRIGIDVERIGNRNHLAIAERYFSPREIAALKSASEAEQALIFYRIWSRKEAIVKAVGTGLSMPLSSFSVAADGEPETLELAHEHWNLLSIATEPGFQAALATSQGIDQVGLFRLP